MTVPLPRKRSRPVKERRATRRPKPTAPALARISPPILASVCERGRLYEILDEANRRPVIFFVAPAGAGKTTLAASYVKARHRPCLWLQLEADNADPASFVYYLRLAAQRLAPRRAARLPLLTAEYRQGLPTFAKQLFETLARALPADTVLVLDNYQDVGADAALHGFLAEGLTTLPPGMRLLCLSRQAPPAALARRRAEGAVTLLDWDALRFTLEETAAIAKMRCAKNSVPSPATLQQLHARTHGWAAGLMLLLESPDSTAAGSPGKEQGDQTTFDYLAAEVLQRLDPAVRDLLPPLAIPSAVSAAMATELTGNPHAGQRLEELAHSNCFTTRHASGHYQFHPLFRNLLLNELRSSITEGERQRLQRSAANLLVDEGRPEEAAHLFIETANWSGLAELIVENAQGLLTEGRHDTLTTWLRAVPEDVRDANPWLLYFLGAARLPFDLSESRSRFEQATQRFAETGDYATGLVLAWSGIIQSIATDWGNSALLRDWIAFAERKIVPRLAQLTPELQGRAIHGMFLALQFNQPEHPDMALWAERLEAVVNGCTDPGDRIQMGGYLLLYYISWRGDMNDAERLVRSLRPQRLESLTVVARLHWHCIHIRWLWQNNLNQQALNEIECALTLANASGVHIFDFLIQAGGVYASINAQDLDAAARYLAQAERPLSPHRPVESCHHQLLNAWLDRVRGDAAAARRRIEWTVATLAPTSSTFELSIGKIELAHSLRLCGDYTAALAHGEQALTMSRAYHGRWREYLALACLAETAFASGDTARGLATLREAYRIASQSGYRSLMHQCPKSMALLCSKALAANIEPEHCRALIAAHRLAPPESERFAEHWPFPIGIRTLGDFRLLKDGRPLHFEGKAPRKPLELLKVLVALGGRDVRQERLADILWPNATEDSSHSAFTTTLQRLRRLVGDDTVVVYGGRVSLDPRYCWVDVWALEALLAQIQRAPSEPVLMQRILDLYQGPFLRENSDELWAIHTRERLANRFVSCLSVQARHLAGAGRWEETATLYARGIEADPLIEELHRGLMTAYHKLGRRAEALVVFERLRALLQRTFGIDPAVETATLAQAIRADHKASGRTVIP